MTIFCEALIFLSLTLLALIVAIFVVAVSFLGRAIEQSSAEEERLVQLAKAELDETINKVRKRLSRATASGKGVDDARKELEQYQQKEKEFREERAKASKRYELLTTKQGVLYPGVVLLVAILFAGVGKILGDVSGTPAQVLSYVLPVLATIGLISVCYRAYRALSVVQGVATLPEDVYLKRTVDAFRVAMTEHEEAKRPELDLVFNEPTPPLKFKASAEESIMVQVSFQRGDVAKAIELWIVAPQAFAFITPEARPWKGGGEIFAWAAKIDVGDLVRGIVFDATFTVKTPDTPGVYLLAYYLVCEGYTSGFEEFNIEVVE